MYTTVNFLKTLKRDPFKVKKLEQLYVYWNDERHGFERRSNYWAYDTNLHCFCDLNGVPRPGQEKYMLL